MAYNLHFSLLWGPKVETHMKNTPAIEQKCTVFVCQLAFRKSSDIDPVQSDFLYYVQ